MKILFSCCTFLFVFFGMAQSADSSDFDTIYAKRLKQVDIREVKKARTEEQEMAYQRLKRKVIKLYPYALMAKQVNTDINSTLDTIGTRKQKRKFKSQKEKALRERFEIELKSLYRSDGPVLVKLIHRETGLTAFDLIDQFKSGFKMWTYQIAAKSQGFSLKEIYDSNKDADIEGIIQSMQKDGTLPTGY